MYHAASVGSVLNHCIVGKDEVDTMPAALDAFGLNWSLGIATGRDELDVQRLDD